MTERKRWLAGCLSALLSLPLAAAVPGPDAPADLARGKAMAQKMCSRCHDDDGNGGPRPNRSYPKLAGLDREYLYKQIYDLKTQRRRNPATNGRGEELSAADVVNVSAWFAAQRMSAGEQTLADPAQRERGRQLFENGLAQRGVPPCVTCHGPAAQGLAALKAPRLAGQWAEYLATQLHGFRDGKRGNSATMRAVCGVVVILARGSGWRRMAGGQTRHGFQASARQMSSQIGMVWIARFQPDSEDLLSLDRAGMRSQ